LNDLYIGPGRTDVPPYSIGNFFFAPWLALLTWQPGWTICLYIAALCWLYYRFRRVAYAFISWVIWMILCHALIAAIQIYPSIVAFNHLFEWMTISYQWQLLFVITCAIVVTCKYGMRLFVPFDLKTLICCCMATLVPWYAVLMWLHLSMTFEFAMFFLNLDLFPFFFCMMFLSSLLDVWILDTNYAIKRTLNMTTVIGVNSMMYCLMTVALYYG
jgi:hypothetical protein